MLVMGGCRKLQLRYFLFIILIFITAAGRSQVNWVNVDSAFGSLPEGIQVFRTNSSLDGKPNIAYYVAAELKNYNLLFETDTTLLRRITPSSYFQKNNKPVIVVNGSFFAPDHRNLNVVITRGKTVSFSPAKTRKSAADSTVRVPVYSSAIGISKDRSADIAWLLTDSSWDHVKASQVPLPLKKNDFEKWKMETAIGGGPVLIQNGKIAITNNEELKFAGKAIHDKHPRTAMGYTAGKKLIILVVEGRNKGTAEGVSLLQLAKMLSDLGCVEALNLDGGGSSCLLVNGKETIRPSDLTGQRPVPAVFLVRSKN
jgi:hypothetical protein